MDTLEPRRHRIRPKRYMEAGVYSLADLGNVTWEIETFFATTQEGE